MAEITKTFPIKLGNDFQPCYNTGQKNALNFKEAEAFWVIELTISIFVWATITF